MAKPRGKYKKKQLPSGSWRITGTRLDGSAAVKETVDTEGQAVARIAELMLVCAAARTCCCHAGLKMLLSRHKNGDRDWTCRQRGRLPSLRGFDLIFHPEALALDGDGVGVMEESVQNGTG